MLLLSSLLGPARPPVASREDVASAPGLYQLRQKAGTLVAAALHGGIDHICLAPGERCLVCLCDYEVGEEIRRLTKCNHLFHRECIDQVRPRAPYLNPKVRQLTDLWLEKVVDYGS